MPAPHVFGAIPAFTIAKSTRLLFRLMSTSGTTILSPESPPEPDAAAPKRLIESCQTPASAMLTPDEHQLLTKKRRYWIVVASHIANDIYPIFFAALVLVFTEKLSLTGGQKAIIYAVAQILSGLPQGFFAWATDRFDTRICGPLGLLLSAVCTCLMGFAGSFESLLVLVAVAQIGNGMYHPVAAALAGQLGAGIMKRGRALAVSVFFAAGMVGSVIGPKASTWIQREYGLPHLAWLMIPGIIGAIVLYTSTRGATHRHANHSEIKASIPPAEARARWLTVGILFCGNVSRFIVNNALIVLFPIWASSRMPGDTQGATALTANLIVAMTIGMGIAAIFAARLVPAGRERGAIFFMSILGAIATAFMGYAGTHSGLWAMYIVGALTALGFAAVLPITISLAQRLLPGRTGLASGLMMGVAWSSGAFSAPLASLFLGGVSLNEAKSLPTERIDAAFVWFAAILLLGGVLGLAMPSKLVKKAAEHH